MSTQGSGSTTIDGMSSASVAIMDSTSNAELNGFHLTNGNASGGGGVKCTAGMIHLEDLIIEGNQASYGSGIIGTVQSQITADYLLIYNNINHQGMAGLAGLYFRDESSINLNHCTIVNDFSSETNAENSIKIFNETTLSLNNTVLWNLGSGNVLESYNGWGVNTINVDSSNIEGGIDSILQTEGESIINWGGGNIDAYPLFCDPDSGNYYLAYNSPCAGTGQDGADMGALGVGCDDIWLPPVITAIEDTSMDEDSELVLLLSAESSQDYYIYFETQSDTSSVYAYTEGDMLVIDLMTDWNGTSEITVLAYCEFDYDVNDTATFTLTVNPVDDLPFVDGHIYPRDYPEDFGVDTVAYLPDVFTDIDGELTFSYSFTDSSVLAADVSSDYLVLSSLPDSSGETELMVTATNPTRASVTDTVQVSVWPVNDAPVVSIPDTSMNEDS